MDRKVIAVVGPIASGKGALIGLLKEKGYSVLSLSDAVREKATIWGLTHTRENLQNVGDKLRKQFGSSILAELATQEIKKNPDKKYVVDAVRNPAELDYLRKEFNAFVIGITASPEKRFELMKLRHRGGDPVSWEEFKKVEERDRGVGQDIAGQQVEACIRKADVVIDNNGNLEDFNNNISYFLKQLGY